MIRSILLSVVILAAPFFAQAQEGSPAAEHKWSVGTGIGFASSIGSGPLSQSGFNWQLDGQYRITPSISAGVWMQVVPVTGATVFSMSGQGLYHFGFLRDSSNEFASKLTPYAGIGIGLWHLGLDVGALSDNAFLFQMIGGIEYELTERVGLTSEMRFNILGGTAPAVDDSFYFSWQLIGARYRF